jgi:hypothetical protein
VAEEPLAILEGTMGSYMGKMHLDTMGKMHLDTMGKMH